MKTNLIYLDEETKKFPIIFTLNVMETIQNEYGSMDAWKEHIFTKDKDVEPIVKDLLFGLTEMVNEGIEIFNEENPDVEKLQLVNTKQVGRIVTKIGLEKSISKLGESIIDANKSDKSKNE